MFDSEVEEPETIMSLCQSANSSHKETYFKTHAIDKRKATVSNSTPVSRPAPTVTYKREAPSNAPIVIKKEKCVITVDPSGQTTCITRPVSILVLY